MEKHFLEQYKAQDKPEAKQAAKRKEERTGEKEIFSNKSERIKAYVERLENVFLNPDSRVRERNIEMLKPAIYKNTLIKPEDFPESHFEFHKQQLVDRGIAREQVEQNFDNEKKEQEIQRVIESQKMSLDAWVDYLTGDDCKYPADIKYFAIQGILKLGNFDTEKYSFTKRIPATTAPFPEIDREALSIVLGAVESKNYNKSTDNYSKNLLTLIERGNSFGDMYALTMRELDMKAEKSDLLPIIDGEWRVFEKGSEPQELVDALSGKRSNLCIADIGSATTYLNQGAVEVYFSYNRAKQPTVPRIAVAYDEEKGGVYEVRGTYNKSEDIDPYISESTILMDRLKSLPKGESFAKKDADMKKMTELYRKCFKVDKKTKEKTHLNPELSKEELTFFYEINSSIEGFGYQKDPRITEILETRNPNEDLPILFDCNPDQIATNQNEVNENTKIYNGELYPNIFTELPPSIEKIYTNFPEKLSEVYIKEIEIPSEPKTAEQYIEDLEKDGHKVSDYAKDILPNANLTEGAGKTIKIIIVSNKSLGFPQGATRLESQKRAQELGIANQTLPAIIGPELRKQYINQPNPEYILIDMESVLDRDGGPGVFGVDRGGSESWLGAYEDGPDSGWDDGYRWAFSQI